MKAILPYFSRFPTTPTTTSTGTFSIALGGSSRIFNSISLVPNVTQVVLWVCGCVCCPHQQVLGLDVTVNNVLEVKKAQPLHDLWFYATPNRTITRDWVQQGSKQRAAGWMRINYRLCIRSLFVVHFCGLIFTGMNQTYERVMSEMCSRHFARKHKQTLLAPQVRCAPADSGRTRRTSDMPVA